MAENGMINKAKGFVKNVFGNPEEEYEDNVVKPSEKYNTSNYDSLYGDKVRTVHTSSEDFYDDYKGETTMNVTTMNDDMAAFSSSGIDMELMRPRFQFEDDLSMELISEVSGEVLEALRAKKTVLLDLYDLGDDERTVLTYVVIGAVNALRYTMTNIRDNMIFALTPEGVGVAQDDRVKIQDDIEESSDLKYSNDYR